MNRSSSPSSSIMVIITSNNICPQKTPPIPYKDVTLQIYWKHLIWGHIDGIYIMATLFDHSGKLRYFSFLKILFVDDSKQCPIRWYVGVITMIMGTPIHTEFQRYNKGHLFLNQLGCTYNNSAVVFDICITRIAAQIVYN